MNQAEIEKNVVELQVKIAETLSTLLAYQKRLERIENTVESINELALSTQEIAQETKALRMDVNRIDIRVSELEQKPVKRYEAFIYSAITTIVGVILGYILSGGVF